MNKPAHFMSVFTLVIGLGITAASAETITLKADLKGSNEVPPNSSPATGKAEATLNTETKVLTWAITYKDLTGPVVGAHFHGPSEPGKNAGMVLPLETLQSPIEGERRPSPKTRLAIFLLASGTQIFIRPPIPGASCAVKWSNKGSSHLGGLRTVSSANTFE